MEKLLENELLRKERKNVDQAEMDWVMDMEWMESKPSPVSIEDCTIDGSVDRGLNSTNHMLEIRGSRNQ